MQLELLYLAAANQISIPVQAEYLFKKSMLGIPSAYIDCSFLSKCGLFI